MSGILLGTLTYSGLNNNKIINTNNKLNVYNSNIENKMNAIERNQTGGFAKQFDELRFDMINEPDIDVSGSIGFSNISNSDMNYNIVPRENFTHNNMVPSTSRRDTYANDRSQRKLENFTGNFNNYTAKKEKVPLFEPLADLSYVNGMPAVTGQLQNRYLPSNKNNFGNLPFQNNVKVRPGIGEKVQEGRYSVYRVDYKNVDDLRPETKKKVTFENKPIEAVKKGEFRAPDPFITKTKLPDFRETSFDDLVGSRANIEAPKVTGLYTNTNTSRGKDQEYYTTPAVNTNVGFAPNVNMTSYEPAKKENFQNVYEGVISNPIDKPILLNTKSFTNYDNQRASTNYVNESNVNYGNGLYVQDYNIPITTTRELMINGTTNIGVSGPIENKSYIFSNDMVLPTTNRQLYSDKTIISNATGEIKQPILKNNDVAKETIRQTTSHDLVINVAPTNSNLSSYSNITDKAKDTIKEMNLFQTPEMNLTGIVSDAYSNLTDTAKPTIKQSTIINNIIGGIKSNMLEASYSKDENDRARTTTKELTSNNKYVGHLNSAIYEGGYTRDEKDNAKITHRQTTEINQYIGQANSNANETNYIINKESIARPTIRQATIIKTYSGPLSGEVSHSISHQAANNMDIDDRREIAVNFNRPANGRKDANGPYIDENNVKLNEPIHFSHFPGPNIGLDYSIMPSKEKPSIEPIYETSEYYINSNFINTLKNNPLVNDIYHPKNV